jgi:uncharacterized membrane protein YtjA (UPF0391 family)
MRARSLLLVVGSGRVPATLSRERRLAAQCRQQEMHMLGWALTFLVIAIIAAIFGFGGIAAGAAGIAKVLFFIFLVIFVVSLIWGLVGRRRV